MSGSIAWPSAHSATAVPILEDLIGAVRTDQVRDMFDSLKLAETSEKASQIFERYIADLIRRFPTLNAPTRLDFGPARIIVLDLQYVSPTGSAAANRQSEMMYLLARHIVARNFFLHPEYLAFVPDRVAGYHRKRFTEVYETVKRVDYDEWHRTQGSPLVRAQAELDVREGRKHNVQLGFASQRLSDMGDGIIAQSTGRFVLGADDRREYHEIIERFGLTEASAKIVRHRLTGPRRDGAPFLAIFRAEQAHYEQFLVNSLGPVELWALSTTPGDTSLRNRLYEKVGFSESLRRLSKVFPNGSAMDEIERRTKARLRTGDAVDRVEAGVVDELARELIEGHGLGLVLRPYESTPRRRLGVGRRVAPAPRNAKLRQQQVHDEILACSQRAALGERDARLIDHPGLNLLPTGGRGATDDRAFWQQCCRCASSNGFCAHADARRESLVWGPAADGSTENCMAP